MTIEQLQNFYAISKYRTFSQAAIEMNLTQSALSKQIAKLELELNAPLFDRSHRQITLTTAGECLLKDVVTLLQDYEQLLTHLKIIKEQDRTTIKLALLPVFAHFDFSNRLHRFSAAHPYVQLQQDEIEERDLLHKLDYHAYDVYLLRETLDALHDFERIRLYEDVLVAVVAKDHHLATQQSISLKQLAQEPLLVTPKYTAIASLVVQACHKAGFDPRIHRHGRLETILSAAGNKDGVALVMKKSLPIFHLPNVVMLPLEEEVHGDIYLYYSLKNHADIVSELINFLHPRKT